MTGEKLIVFFDYFHPAYKAGGPIRTSKGFAEILSAKYNIDIVTRANDVGESKIMDSVISNKWTRIDNSYNVFYSTSKGYFKCLLKSRKKDYDFIYLNSFFSLKFTIIPLILWKIWSFLYSSSAKIVIAPRGELIKDALNQKRSKKKIYIFWFKYLLIKNIIFQATSDAEKEEISTVLGISQDKIRIAINLRSINNEITFKEPSNKKVLLRIISVSRITPIKNIDYAIKVLSALEIPIIYDIYGPIENKEYYQLCRNLINEIIPENIQVKFHGPVDENNVIPLIQNYHLFFSPSKSENFGHTIFESLLAGRPVLISDNTYWRNIKDKSAGWDISLNSIDKYRATLINLFKMNNNSFIELCFGARKLADEYISYINNSGTQQYMALFK